MLEVWLGVLFEGEEEEEGEGGKLRFLSPRLLKKLMTIALNECCASIRCVHDVIGGLFRFGLSGFGFGLFGCLLLDERISERSFQCWVESMVEVSLFGDIQSVKKKRKSNSNPLTHHPSPSQCPSQNWTKPTPPAPHPYSGSKSHRPTTRAERSEFLTDRFFLEGLEVV